MTDPQIRFDLRAPAFGAPREALYAAALDMAAYADRHGFTGVLLSEHHGSDDGYLPSAIVMAAAIAARTSRVRLQLYALVAPLYDPVKLAEDIAVLDLISQGRVSLCVAGGYVRSEFEMFGRDMARRPALLEEAVRVLKAAWTGEPFEYRGRTLRVTPRPLQRPHPHLLMGGTVAAAARRGARLADGFVTNNPDMYRVFHDEAVALGKQPPPFRSSGPGTVFVAEDPDLVWRQIGPHVLHEMNAYGRWAAEQRRDNAAADSAPSYYKPVTSLEELQAHGNHVVLTPADCIPFARKFGNFFLNPLVGGLDPAVGWRSLELFAAKVLPHLRDAP